ncbi:MAG TPA: class I SAM-dependent methyltransferase [Armatimonadota bacterium]
MHDTISGGHGAQGVHPAVPLSGLEAIKAAQRAMWSSGNFENIGSRMVIVGELLCDAIDLRSGERVLDVATGNGSTALAAARRYGEVTGTDYVPALLADARARAAAEHLEADFRDGDAEALPFPDASFDVVLSTFGAMFAPDQERVARELLRVCRPGGRIGLANWTPNSFPGRIFRIVSKYMQSPPELRPPMLWGTEPRLRELLGDGTSQLQATPRCFTFRHRSPEHWLEVFRGALGPLGTAFSMLDPDAQAQLAADLLTLAREMNQSGDSTLVLPGEYLEVIATRA